MDELAFVVMVVTLTAAAAIFLTGSGDKKTGKNQQQESGAEMGKKPGFSVVFKRMADYDSFFADMPAAKDEMLKSDIRIRIAGLPFLTCSEVDAYRKRQIQTVVFNLLKAGSPLVLTGVRRSSSFFGLEADVIANGRNIAEIVAQFDVEPEYRPEIRFTSQQQRRIEHRPIQSPTTAMPAAEYDYTTSQRYERPHGGGNGNGNEKYYQGERVH
jgi:hypothetical protein